MSLVPDPAWPTLVLAVVMLADAAMSVHPPRFIRDFLDGVAFPRHWWWVLVVVKLMAAGGLALGLVVPGIGLAANAGVVCYFLTAAVAHLRARFLRREFWLNCLGMLALSMLVLVASYLR
ncbi:DoxX family protein [Arthrobacter sp. JSM 101049]|uniref:DoxX family protein n=1 Tax=Arthrobacter sp. JSM 101049 TaxID=929097 RepID=UPI0035667C76